MSKPQSCLQEVYKEETFQLQLLFQKKTSHDVADWDDFEYFDFEKTDSDRGVVEEFDFEETDSDGGIVDENT